MPRVEAEPYREMLRRLAAAGWSLPAIMREHGIPEGTSRDRAKWVTPETAEKVQRLYDEIGGRINPHPHAQTMRAWRERGYLVPFAEKPEDQLPLPPKVVEQRVLDARAKREKRSRLRPRCQVFRCRRKRWGRGMCHAHYMRWRRTGEVIATPIGPARKRKTDAA